MRKTFLAALAFSASALSMAAVAQGDPPARIARVSFVSGDASIRHGTTGDWMAFVINYPVTGGDWIWTDNGARTELHIGSTAMQLGERTSLDISALDDRRVELTVAEGAMVMRVRTLGPDESFVIVTPSGSARIASAGLYRVNVDTDGNAAQIVVRSGIIDVSAAGSNFRITDGQTAYLTGGASAASEVRDDPSGDDLDSWAGDRDRREDASASVRYVSNEMTGYEDLDQYGHWTFVAGYGNVWAPNTVSPGWAPYRLGYWAWVQPWGWTWIDQEPWGFAPFHYGRWAYAGAQWVWVPGVRVVRPVYAPALVVFVGGATWGAAHFGGAGVAWFPLAPGEPFRPGYHVSDRYVRNVNVTNVNVTNVNVTNVNVANIPYRNRDVEGATTAATRETFLAAKPMRGSAAAVPVSQVRDAPIVGHSAPLTPRHESEVLASNGRAAPRPPAQVIQRTTPTPVPRPPEMRPPDVNRPSLSQHGGNASPPASPSDHVVAPKNPPTHEPRPAEERTHPVPAASHEIEARPPAHAPAQTERGNNAADRQSHQPAAKVRPAPKPEAPPVGKDKPPHGRV